MPRKRSNLQKFLMLYSKASREERNAMREIATIGVVLPPTEADSQPTQPKRKARARRVKAVTAELPTE